MRVQETPFSTRGLILPILPHPGLRPHTSPLRGRGNQHRQCVRLWGSVILSLHHCYEPFRLQEQELSVSSRNSLERQCNTDRNKKSRRTLPQPLRQGDSEVQPSPAGSQLCGWECGVTFSHTHFCTRTRACPTLPGRLLPCCRLTTTQTS